MGKSSKQKKKQESQKNQKLTLGSSVPPTPTSANDDSTELANNDPIDNPPARTSTPGYMTPPTSPSTPSRELDKPMSSLTQQLQPVIDPTPSNTGATMPPADEVPAQNVETGQEQTSDDQQTVDSEPLAEQEADGGITITIAIAPKETQPDSSEQQNTSQPPAENQLVDVGAGEPPVTEGPTTEDSQKTSVVTQPPDDEDTQDPAKHSNASPNATEGSNENEGPQVKNKPDAQMDPPSSSVINTQDDQPPEEAIVRTQQHTDIPEIQDESVPDVSQKVADAGISAEERLPKETTQPNDAESEVTIEDPSSEVHGQGPQSNPDDASIAADNHGQAESIQYPTETQPDLDEQGPQPEENSQTNHTLIDDPEHEQASDKVVDDEQTPTERRNTGSADLLFGEPEQGATTEVAISSETWQDDDAGYSPSDVDNPQLQIIIEEPEDEAYWDDGRSPHGHDEANQQFVYTASTPGEYEGHEVGWHARYDKYQEYQQQQASDDMQLLRAGASPDISAKDLASRDLLAVADLFANMKNALTIMTDAFDRLGPQTEKVASFGQDVKAAEQLQRIKSTLEAQISRHKSQVEILKSTLRAKVREAAEAKIRNQLQDVIRSSIQATVEERVRQELAMQIPEDLRKQVISHKRQILEVRASLHNSEARRYNALQTMPDLNAPLRPLLRPLPTPEQSPIVISISRSSSMGNSTLATPATAFPRGPAPTPIRRTASNSFRPETVPPSPSPFFPRDMTTLFALNAEETKRLLREYGLTSAVASPATGHPTRPRALSIVDEDAAEEDTEIHARDLNVFMAHIGVPFLMIPAPKEKHHESAPLSSRSRRKLLTPLIIK